MNSGVEKPGDLLRNGPLVAVRLCVPEGVEVEPIATPIDILAEIDTSVLVTRIREDVATSLGLEPEEMVTIMTDTTAVYETYLYRIRLEFPSGNVFEVDAIEVPYMMRRDVRIKCLIGRDILSHGILTYNGFLNTCSPSFSAKNAWTRG